MKALYISSRGNSVGIERFKILIGLLLYRFSLDFLYINVIVDLYNIYGFRLDIEPIKVIISYIVLIIISTLITSNIKDSRPSSTILLLLILLAFVPNTSLFGLMNIDYIFIVISTIYWLIVAFFYRFIPNLRLNNNNVSKNNFFITINKYLPFGFLIVIISFSYLYNGLRINIDLSDVYDMRMESRQLGIPGFMNYILPWAGNIVFPIVIIESLRRKRFLIATIFIYASLVLFSVSGMKTWLFILIISVMWILVIRSEDYIFKIPLFLSIINIISYIETVAFKSDYFANFITRRVFFSTSLSNSYYIDFFHDNPKLYLTDSAFGWIKRFGYISPYDNEPVSRLIGRIYYNNLEMNASSGTIADAYTNLGFLGLIIYPFILIILLKLMDSSSKGLNTRYIIPVYVSMAIYILNGNIFSVLITYGFIFSLFYLYFLPRQKVHTKIDN